MTTLAQDTVLPPDGSLAELDEALVECRSHLKVNLLGPDGEALEVPTEVLRVLQRVVSAMADGQAVTVAPVDQLLSTQQAADLLGISRQSLNEILEASDLEFEQTDRHRWVKLVDVLGLDQRRSELSRQSLDRIVEISHEGNMYELAATPTNTR